MNVEPPKKTDRLLTLTHQDLLLGFKKPESSPFTLNDLKIEFHRRVKNRLYQQCLRLCQKNRLDDSTAKEIAQQTILKGLDKINCFEFDVSWPEEKFRNKIAVWLNRIAHNLFIDLLKERSKYVPLDDDYSEMEDDDFRPDDFEFEQDDMIELKLQDALDSLNDRERLIINMCIKYDCLDNKDHLPDDAIADICNSLKLSKGNIRVIKLRALRKIRSKLT